MSVTSQTQMPRLLTSDSCIMFDPVAHTYTVRGYENVQFRSVSQVARTWVEPFDKEFVAHMLMKHRPGKSHAEVLEELEQKIEEGQELGRKFHTAIDTIHNCGYFPAAYMHLQDVCTMHKQWHDWMTGKWRKRPRERTLVVTEVRVFYPEMALAGTIDALLMVDGAYWLVDWKTNKLIGGETRKEYEIQLQLYDFILRKRYNIRAQRLLLLNVHPTRQRAREIEVRRTRTDADLVAICQGKGDATSEEDRVMAAYDC